MRNERQRIQELFLPTFHGLRADVALPGGATIRELVGVAEADDAAVLRCSGEFDLVVASDYVRGPRFQLFEAGLLTYADLGRYLVAANISDLAAMGARPLALLTVLRYPPEMTDGELQQVLDGIRESAQQHGAAVIGGDTGSAERLILSATALGAASPGTSLRRSGGTLGDDVWLAGGVGLAAAALLYHTSGTRCGLSEDEETEILRPWQHPRAQVELGIRLAEEGLASACIDISDGLLGALALLEEASGVGVVVDADRVPVHPLVQRVALAQDIDPLILTISNSVDFSLVFTSSPGNATRLQELPGVTRIGTLDARRGVWLRDSSGTRPMSGLVWDHTFEIETMGAQLRGLSGS